MNIAAMPMAILLADNKVRARARFSARVENFRFCDHFTAVIQPDRDLLPDVPE